jgi:RNA polymerase sigma-70 factor (ECF subfamily)
MVQFRGQPSCDSHTSDEALLSLTCEGDGEALSFLFRRYAGLVRGVAYKVLRNPAEADDLLQDIFLLVHRLCRTFDSSKDSARFWILQMTYRRAISRRRYLTSRHFYTHIDLDQAANQLSDASARSGRLNDQMSEDIDRREALQNRFAELSESQRQTLHLFFYEGYTFEEIATKLGQTVGNARNHYYRGLERLRKQISAGKLPAKKQNDGMAKKAKKPTLKVQAWIEARKRHHLSHAQVQMARELGMNPAKVGKIDNHKQEPWKLPLPQFIEELYSKRFGKTSPEAVLSIEERCRRKAEKKEERRIARQLAVDSGDTA